MRELYERIHTQVSAVVVGQDAALAQLLSALACRGHALIEGPPGVSAVTAGAAAPLADGVPVSRTSLMKRNPRRGIV